jgi:hypothetical protein
MKEASEIEILTARIAELEEEILRLRPIEAAAKEAIAFWAGRRPGFAAHYPQEILRTAIGSPKRRRTAPPRRPTTQKTKG